MYYLILIFLIGVGAWITKYGVEHSSRIAIISGVCIVMFTLSFFGLMSLWGEMLWFDALDYAHRYWTFLSAQIITLMLGAIVAAAFTLICVWSLDNRKFRHIAISIAALGGITWGLQNCTASLVYLNRVYIGMNEPVFSFDIGFYLFELPFYERLHNLALFGTFIGLVTCISALFKHYQQRTKQQRSDTRKKSTVLFCQSWLAVFCFSLFWPQAIS
jgi:uncharacterized protein